LFDLSLSAVTGRCSIVEHFWNELLWSSRPVGARKYPKGEKLPPLGDYPMPCEV